MTTMSNGSVRLRSPRLWAIGCVLILGLTLGIVLAYACGNLVFHDLALHDTYFVVVHLHYVLHLPLVFGFFAGWYYLFPKITGYAYSDTLGRVHFWLLFIGVAATLLPQVILASGLVGRGITAADWFRGSNLVSWIGSALAAAGIFVFFANMALSFLRGWPAD